MKDLQFAKVVVFVSSLVPLAMLIMDKTTGQAGADPAFYMMRITGYCALIFLLLTLCVTPLRRITGKNFWSVFRKMLGLYAFFYAGLHLLVFWSLYQKGDIGLVFQEALKRKFIFLGMTAFLLMVPLAATSTAWAIKKMGNKKWKLLHKLVYLSAIAAVIHFCFAFKQPSLEEILAAFRRLDFPAIFNSVGQLRDIQVIYVSILAGLLLFRVVAWARDKWFPAAKPARAPAPVRTPAS